jgi:hypothetical protein
MAIGRISGPLLKANLVRDGIDLAFETDLLYLDVNNSRIGINNGVPQYDLDISGTARTTDLEVTNTFDIGNFSINTNTITSDQPTINFVAGGGEATAFFSRLIVNDIELDGNTISTNSSNADLELRANGTGTVNLLNNTTISGDLSVDGNITATGNIQIDGNLIIGDSITDSITINASLNSNLIPENDSAYDLGSVSSRWRNVYASTLISDTLNLSTFNVGNLILQNNEITTTTGENLILDANGIGAVVIGNFAIVDNTITNTVSGSITEISQTGTGYFKINGTNAFVPPVGSTAERPTAYAVIGMTRYNTDSNALEVWDGLTWASPAGTTGAVSEGTANDIAARFALILG